ncbi:MAG: hypothetical protein R6X13_02120 [bacterium]
MLEATRTDGTAGPPAPDPRKPGAHHRLFGIGGITIRVESDLPFTDRTFDPKFQQFELDGPGHDTVTIRHHFELPAIDPDTLGREVYRKPPWSIYRRDSCWVYLGVLPEELGSGLFKVAVFNAGIHRHAREEGYPSPSWPRPALTPILVRRWTGSWTWGRAS